MYILCDTCSILMLIRIAPDMFIDERFNCCTIHAVKNEIYQTQKFKNKYFWKDKYKPFIKPIGNLTNETSDFDIALKTINVLIKSGARNSKTDLIYNLSYEDKKVAATVVAHDYYVSTEDNDLTDILQQHFEKENLCPLHLVNNWIERELIVWDDEKQAVIEDWLNCKEPPQPQNEIYRFEQLTGITYAGPK